MIGFCANVEEWMEKDKQNVIAIHCKGGKGRTGTMICTWLVHCGVFEEAKVSGVDPVVLGSIYHMKAPETYLIRHNQIKHWFKIPLCFDLHRECVFYSVWLYMYMYGESI